MLDFDYLKSICAAQQLPFSPELAEKLDRYAQMLVEWNEKINLTAITEPGDIAVKHFADSLLLLKACDIPQNARIIDVGTGAGFPSVPVCLARPDLRLTLLDSLQKRITFLNQLCTALSLPADCVHGRAEETGRKPEYREHSSNSSTSGGSTTKLGMLAPSAKRFASWHPKLEGCSEYFPLRQSASIASLMEKMPPPIGRSAPPRPTTASMSDTEMPFSRRVSAIIS